MHGAAATAVRAWVRGGTLPGRTDLFIAGGSGVLGMRQGALGVVAVVALVGTGLTFVLADGESDRPGVEVVTPVVAHNAAALASIALPAGWQELPVVDTTDPNQVLVIGTAARPEGEPINPCDTSAAIPPGAAFVSVYEYLTGARLNAPDHASVFDATQFVSRPADFSASLPASESSCASGSQEAPPPGSELPPDAPVTTAPPTVSTEGHLADFTFLDGGRFFVARVVSVDDPGDERFREAIGVLNTLVIALPPEATTTTGPGPVPTTAVPVEEQDVAHQQITDALRGAFGGGGPVNGDGAVTPGFPLGEGAREAARETHQEYIGGIVPRVNWLTLDTPTHATVNFDLFIDGQIITATTTGEALFVDGRWKITAETFCTVARRGGVTCPDP